MVINWASICFYKSFDSSNLSQTSPKSSSIETSSIPCLSYFTFNLLSFIPVNPCANPLVCGEGATCHVKKSDPTQHKCTCENGYRLKNNYYCVDKDECASGTESFYFYRFAIESVQVLILNFSSLYGKKIINI